jgi:hypothetical protein
VRNETLEEKTNRLNEAAENGSSITKLELYDIVAHELDIELTEHVDRYSNCMDDHNKWRGTKFTKHAVLRIQEMAKHLTEAEFEILLSRYKIFNQFCQTQFYQIVRKEKTTLPATNLQISAVTNLRGCAL